MIASYSTTNLYIAAALLAKGFLYTSMTEEGLNKKIKRFHFEVTDLLRKTINEYKGGTLEGNLKFFKNSLEIIRDEIHNV